MIPYISQRRSELSLHKMLEPIEMGCFDISFHTNYEEYVRVIYLFGWIVRFAWQSWIVCPFHSYDIVGKFGKS